MPTQVAFTAAMRAIGFHHFPMPLHGLNFADLLAPFKTQGQGGFTNGGWQGEVVSHRADPFTDKVAFHGDEGGIIFAPCRVNGRI